MNLTELTIVELHEGFKKKQFTSTQVVQQYLDHIKATDEKIGSYLAITEDLALEQAAAADKIIATEKDFPMLMGIPFSVKDAILVEGVQATSASKILEPYKASYDATVIKRLKMQGAVILGKTNLDEFAMGASTENSAYKVTKNPHDLSKVAGGSSGGSAASVAAKQAVFSLGSDTGGSIRLPASFCGVVGLKPTYGAVSRSGLIALASSLDQIGPFTKTVEDAQIVMEAISGKDSLDATSAEYMYERPEVSMKGLKIGVPTEYFAEGIDPEVRSIIENAIEKAKTAGAKIVEISLPSVAYGVACYYITLCSEASANLARFDGIKYGFSLGRSQTGEAKQDAGNLMDVYIKSRGTGFGAEPKRRIMLGTYSLSSGYYDAYYKKAQEVRELIRSDFAKAFEKVDVIFAPVSPTPAFAVGEKAQDPLAMYLVDIYTVSAPLAGIPGVSIPAGSVGNLPVGLQIMGNYFEDAKVLAVASQMESVLK